MNYDDPHKAIDNYHLARSIIKQVFERGYSDKKKISFLPKITEEELGNGLHVHLSIWHKGKNILGSPKEKYGLS